MDTIPFKLTYQFTDSLYNVVPKTDTITALYRHPRLSEKARETYEKNKKNRKLELKTNASSKFDIYDTLFIYPAMPLDSIHEEMISLKQQVDTTMQPVSFQLWRKDTIGMCIGVIAHLKASETYQLTIDSAACRDIYGACNEQMLAKFRLKSLDDYSSLMVKMTHFDARARIQVLNEKDVVVRELSAKEEGTKFEYLTPTTYYLRLYIDLNGDGKWTTGDWLTKRQPEPVYYYPSKLKLRANWDFEENFDHLAVPQVESKPQALIGKTTKKK
jgi:hypothetical protein